MEGRVLLEGLGMRLDHYLHTGITADLFRLTNLSYTLVKLFQFSRKSADLFRVSWFDRNFSREHWRRQNILNKLQISMASYLLPAFRLQGLHGHKNKEKKSGEFVYISAR